MQVDCHSVDDLSSPSLSPPKSINVSHVDILDPMDASNASDVLNSSDAMITVDILDTFEGYM